MHQRIRPLSQKMEAATYENDKKVFFSALDGEPLAETASARIPIPLMYRLYHIGRAYDLPQIANMHPKASVSLGFLSVQVLKSELELVSTVLRDGALNNSIEKILSALKAIGTKGHVLYKPGT